MLFRCVIRIPNMFFIGGPILVSYIKSVVLIKIRVTYIKFVVLIYNADIPNLIFFLHIP